MKILACGLLSAMLLAGTAAALESISQPIATSGYTYYAIRADGALLAWDILKDKPLTLVERVTVISAIGNHDESTGGAKDPVSAALVLADKTDVRRNRVREKEREKFDIHDRVNFAVTGSSLKVDPEEAKISLNLQVDESICTMYEYFDIFLGRMMMCRGAAEMLGANFRLTVNGGKVL